jgi:DNA-directed RNA polymerase subunit RPC12/RpoP
MCLIIDKKYVNILSSSLEKFAWKKKDLANCRCPYCGDSQKNKRKARGYFYVKKNDMFYRCHNCGIGTTIYKFLEYVSPVLAKEYSLERWRNGENGHSNYKKPELILEFEKPKTTNNHILSNLKSDFLLCS